MLSRRYSDVVRRRPWQRRDRAARHTRQAIGESANWLGSLVRGPNFSSGLRRCSVAPDDVARIQMVPLDWAEPVLGLRLAVHVEDRVSVWAELSRRAASYGVSICDGYTTWSASRRGRWWIGERAHSQDRERAECEKHAFHGESPFWRGE